MEDDNIVKFPEVECEVILEEEKEFFIGIVNSEDSETTYDADEFILIVKDGDKFKWAFSHDEESKNDKATIKFLKEALKTCQD